MAQYESKFWRLVPIWLPPFTDTRVLMLPFKLEDIETLPNDLWHYKLTVEELIAISPVKEGVAYLTIDEKSVKKGDTLRQRGLHVDGLGADGRPDDSIWATAGIRHMISSMWDEGNRKWNQGAQGIGGMITVSNPAGCRAWNKNFQSIPATRTTPIATIRKNGDCELLRSQFPDEESTVFESGIAYWCNAACVHESMPMEEDTKRTFVRLSMPNNAPWYEGYTKNPKGVDPSGIIVPAHGPSYLWRPKEPEVILKG